MNIPLISLNNFRLKQMNTVEFFEKDASKKVGKFYDNELEIRNMKLNKSPDHLSISNFVPRAEFWDKSGFGTEPSQFSYYAYLNEIEKNKYPNGHLKYLWCPFGSNMVYGTIDNNPKDWIELWTKEDKRFFRGDPTHPDSFRVAAQRELQADYFTEGNGVIGFATLKDALTYISISLRDSKEKNFIDDQILKFLSKIQHTNINGNALSTGPIGSSFIHDAIHTLAKVGIELPKSSTPYHNDNIYYNCIKTEKVSTFDKKLIEVVYYNMKLANIKRIRINKNNEELFRVFTYNIKESIGSYKAFIRASISSDASDGYNNPNLTLVQSPNIVNRGSVNNPAEDINEHPGTDSAIIKEDADMSAELLGIKPTKEDWMGKEESNDIRFTLIPYSQDDENDEESIDRVLELTDEALNKAEKGLANATEEMIATEMSDLNEIPDEEDLDDMDIKDIESIALEDDEEIDEEDLDETDYSDHIEESIDLPDCCNRLKI